MNPDRLRHLVGERIRIAREAKGWTQEVLAQSMEIADRQTLSTIESGERKVSADELMKFIAVLERPLAFFTDPHLVVEENAFSYRAKAESKEFSDFERKAKKLIELNRRLRTLLAEPAPIMFAGMRGLSKTSPLETAEFYGYRFFANWQLGEPPAKKLKDAITTKHNVLILMVDAPDGISGAACHLDDGDVILINRHEPRHRQNYTLGHEFFHLLTWQEMPPQKLDEPDQKSKVEQLADSFTANLLVPSTLLKKAWDRAKGSETERVMDVARHFEVSGTTAYWRLVNGRHLRDPGKVILNTGLRRKGEKEKLPPLFDACFVKRVHRAIADGRISAGSAADSLELSRAGLSDLFRDYELNDPVDA